MSLIELSKVFSEYGIYPQNHFTSDKSLSVYEKYFPNDPYNNDLKIILEKQPLTSKFGADLPWWGVNYFNHSPGKRIMAISQDTNAREAGSIALHSHLMGKNNLDKEISVWKGMKTFKEFFDNFLSNYNYLYVTDAGKVRNPGNGKIDKEKSAKLLFKEITICNPDLIIVFGINPTRILNLTYPSEENISKEIKYAGIPNLNIPIERNGKKYVISPFLTGQGRYGKDRSREDFTNGYNKAIELIKRTLYEK